MALERRDEGALEKMRKFDDNHDVVYTTAVTVAECYRGAYGSKNRAKALNNVRGLLDRFSILNLDYESGKIWGELVQSLKSNTIGDRDLFIASIAISNKQILVTKNKKHFERVPGLRVEDW